ncbi:MAG: M90 family metallopeptidase [Ferruginibacter sp.]
MVYIIIFAFFLIAGIFFIKKNSSKKIVDKTEPGFVNDSMLEIHIAFYRQLNKEDRIRFREGVKKILRSIKITGVDTTVEDIDRIMIASSALIPVFAFPDWDYHNLKEVLLYSDMINDNFQTVGEDRIIMGMVGSGYMNEKMLLSRHALRQGFSNRNDTSNTAIHEFVHLIDKMDGDTDGLPKVLMQQQFVIPWLEMLRKNMEEIAEGRSDINPYGITNQAEFFAVVSEYFFEQPGMLQEKHPDIFALLQEVFLQKPKISDK